MYDRFEPISAPPAEQRLRFAYDGKGRVIAGIATTNALFTIVTLGIYRFWAKTRLRRYIWSRIEFAGDRLDYSGTGKELLVGFLIAILVLAPLIAINSFATNYLPPGSLLINLEQAFYALIILFLINLAFFRARRYRLTRTNWRGIRFNQTGSAFRFAVKMTAWQLLVGITLFLAYPLYRTARQRALINETQFGDQKLRMLAKGEPLFGIWFVTWLTVIPTLGLTYVWYRVREFNNFANRTRFGDHQVDATLSTWTVMKVVLINLVIQIVLLAIFITLLGVFAGPVVQAIIDQDAEAQIGGFDLLVPVILFFGYATISGIMRLVFFMQPLLVAVLPSVAIKGAIDFDTLSQARGQVPQRGEGLFDALDVGEV